MQKGLIFFILLFSFSNCTYSQMQKNNKLNIPWLNEWDHHFIWHFPEVYQTDSSYYIGNIDPESNLIDIIFYEFNLTSSQLDSIENDIKSEGYMVKYSEEDSCLLKVSNFIGLDSTKLTHVDSLRLFRPCYNHRVPIPNFEKYIDTNNIFTPNIDYSFITYVIDAKSGKFYKKYNLKPIAQMPDDWKNGYSLGITLSKKKSTVIYWVIIW